MSAVLIALGVAVVGVTLPVWVALSQYRKALRDYRAALRHLAQADQAEARAWDEARR